jgi:hypothetical protein
LEEPRQPLDYARNETGRRVSLVGALIKVVVALAGVVLILLAMWRLFGKPAG